MEVRESVGTVSHEDHFVILSAGEADARDPTSDSAFDAVNRTAHSGRSAREHRAFIAVETVVRSFTRLDAEFRMTCLSFMTCSV